MAPTKAELGERVKLVLKDREWSYQRASVATEIPAPTIARMALGIVPGADHIINWARAIGQNINEWLILAGYEPIPVHLVADSPDSANATPTHPPAPESLTAAIASAPTREEKVNLAFEFVRKDPFVRVGSSSMSKYPTEAKLSIIRMYERHTGQQLLPPEII